MEIVDEGKKKYPPWLRILLPLLLIVVWFGVGSIGGPTFGKISSVSTNDQASFLPASADSTKVQKLQSRFTATNSLPAILLFESNSTIQPQQLASYAQLGEKLQKVDGVQKPENAASPTVIGPIPSEDKKAVEFIVPISDTKNLKTVVAKLQSTAEKNLAKETRLYVTGPAGLTNDLTKAFGGIDGILLYVAVGAVFFILLIVYRSIILPFIVLLTSVFALSAAILVVYYLAKWNWIQLNGQSQGILSILVIGAATDYSLLLVARYREAFEHVSSRWEAIQKAVQNSFEPILASATTVIVALLCLLLSDLNSNRSLGPIAATGIVFAFLATMTFLPALLIVFGRGSFWPYLPKFSAVELVHNKIKTGTEGLTGIWSQLGHAVMNKHRTIWIVTTILLVGVSLGVLQLHASGVSQTKVILSHSDAVDGQAVLAKHFDAGSGSPVVVIVPQSKVDAAVKTLTANKGIATAIAYAGMAHPFTMGNTKPVVVDGKVLINATLKSASDSDQAETTVRHLRNELIRIDPTIIVGGVTAIAIDTNDTAQKDLVKIIPVVLGVIVIILMLLLRSILAPVLLILTVILSFAATMGLSALVFNHIFMFPGADASVPLFGFVFLVALGIDYNIFLMTRVREESQVIGTRPGIVHALGKTGGVITSAGVVLAATFAALGIIPILFLVQIAFIVSVGVLLDTIIVRSLLVPALMYDIGRAIWWPSKLSRKKR